MLRNIDIAYAVANLLNMGFNSTRAVEIAKDWRVVTQSRSLNNIATYNAKLDVIDLLKSDGLARLFVSFHYSSYAHLYRALALRSQHNAVVSLIGEQSSVHQAALAKLAADFDFTLRFVSGGATMIRSIRNALRDGVSVILLADLPWSPRRTPPDCFFDTCIGRFRALSSMTRLVRAMDPQFAFATVQFRSGKLMLENLPHQDFEDAFQSLGRLILERPQEYERLHQLHRLCELKGAQKPCAIVFCEQRQRYRLFTNSMRLFKDQNSHEASDCDDDVFCVWRLSSDMPRSGR